MSVYPSALPTVRPAVRSAFEQGSGGGAASIIAGLFAQGQQGFWLPFTDFASLTQNSAGTLPYTALEQPVGLILDKSKGGGRGPELSPNGGTFDDAAGWTITQPTSSISGGVLNVGAGACNIFPSTASVVVGKSYEVTFTISNSTANYGIRILNRDIIGTGNYFPAGGQYITANGSYRFVCVAISNGSIGVDRVVGHTGSLQVDNFSVKEIPGNHATQVTSTARGVVSAAVVSPPTRPYYLQLDGTDDFYTCGGGGSTTGFFYSDVVRPMQFGPSYKTLFYNGNPATRQGYFVSLTTSGQLEFAAGNGTINTAIASPVLTLGEAAHICCWDDMVNMYLQVNGGTIYSVPRPAVVSGGATINLFSTGATQNFNGQVTEPIYRAGPPPSAYEREVIRNYQMQKAGML